MNLSPRFLLYSFPPSFSPKPSSFFTQLSSPPLYPLDTIGRVIIHTLLSSVKQPHSPLPSLFLAAFQVFFHRLLCFPAVLPPPNLLCSLFEVSFHPFSFLSSIVVHFVFSPSLALLPRSLNPVPLPSFCASPSSVL